MTQMHRRGLAVVAAAAVAGSLAACGSSPPRSAAGAAPHQAAATWTTRLVVRPADVMAGRPIRAVLVVTYRGRVPVNLTHRCGPKFAVVLTNLQHAPDGGFTSDCHTGPFIIRPGVSRFALTVPTTYQQCTSTARQVTRSRPACLHRWSQGMPLLPPGRYRAILVRFQFAVPAPAPVPVLVRPRR